MSTERRAVPQYIGGGAPLRVVRSEADGRVVLAVHGELDRETTPRLAASISKALAAAPPRVDLDLAGVTFMDSQGLRILLEARRRAGTTTVVAVVNPSGQVDRLLHATGVAEILRVGTSGAS